MSFLRKQNWKPKLLWKQNSLSQSSWKGLQGIKPLSLETVLTSVTKISFILEKTSFFSLSFLYTKCHTCHGNLRNDCKRNSAVYSQAAQAHNARSNYFFKSLCERSSRETWPSYRRHLLLHNDRVWLREMWPSPCSIWWCLACSAGVFWARECKFSGRLGRGDIHRGSRG